MNALDALEGALRVLESNDWCRHVFHYYDAETDGHRYCALGALHKAAKYTGTIEPAKNVLYRLLRDREYDDTIVGWNDDAERTKEEVMELFREAIAFEKSRFA